MPPGPNALSTGRIEIISMSGNSVLGKTDDRFFRILKVLAMTFLFHSWRAKVLTGAYAD